ncbi:MAG TPA: ATP-binding protein [Chitinophagaceae bacterium]|jgi:signal transduction histidine kinase|nr:ATP-binding protein [Chitinophagaceae bacterium]
MKDLPVIFFFIVSFVAFPCYSQQADNPHYNILHFTDENGLPQNSVKAIVPDSRGFAWLATEFGLVRFDGSSFKTFRRDTGSVLNSRVSLFLPSGTAGSYWALADDSKVVQVNESATTVPATTVANNIYTLGHPARGDNIYTTIGLPNIYHDGNHFRYYCIPVDTARYYFITNDSIIFFNRAVQQYSIRFTSNHSLDFFTVNSELYHNTSDGSVLRFNKDSVRKVTLGGEILLDPRYKPGKTPLKLYYNVMINQAFFYLPGSLYYIRRLPDGNLDTERVLSGFDMEVQKIISIYYDSTNYRLLMGSYTEGLFSARKKQFITLNAPSGFDNVYYGHTAFDPGKVLTPRGYIMDSSGPLSRMNAFADIEDLRTYSMLIAADKTIWTNSASHLYHFNKDGTVLLKRWIFKTEVTQLYEDPQKRIWIGLNNSDIYWVPPGKSEPEIAVPGKWNVSYMQQENPDLMWIATDGSCYRLHINDRKMDTVHALDNLYVRSLHVRGPNETWLSTYEEGFFLFKDNKLHSFPTDRNKHLLTSHCILEDEKGFFWISTNKGLFQVARQDLLNYANGEQEELFYQFYEKSNGFLTNEFNGGCEPCGIKLQNGYFSFPSLNGLVWFRPSLIRAELPDKGIFINKIEVNKEEVVSTDTLHIKGDARRVKFYISTPYFGNPYNLNIEYTLIKGTQDTVWLPLGTDKSITFTSLSHGTYHLVIRKCNGFGKDNFTYKTLTIVVPPRFFETTWFKILAGVFLAILVWIYIAYRTRYIRQKNRMLEERIALRTRELEATLTALRESESDLRNQTRIQERLISAIAHDIKSPLKFMIDGARRLFKRLQVPGKEVEKEEAKMLEESGTRVYYYTESLLQYIRSQTQLQNITVTPVDIHQLVEEKIEIFQSIAAEQQTVIHNEVPPGQLLATNGSLLSVILHNLLDNAVKITVDGAIIIAAKQEDDRYILSVTDTGAGMRQPLMDWCNAVQQEQSPGQTGMGLLIVKELVSLIDARLKVENGLEKGTVMKIVFEYRTDQ